MRQSYITFTRAHSTYEISSYCFRCNKIDPHFTRFAFREPIFPVLVVEARFSKIRTKCCESEITQPHGSQSRATGSDCLCSGL